MKYIPKSVSRLAGRSMLKLNAKSPTILVVAGVVGFGATAVLAAKATRKIDPILDEHAKARLEVSQYPLAKREEQKALVRVYTGTSIDLAKLYGPTIVVGALSAAAVLSGHRILKGRYVATMAAYSGLFEQFQIYRGRVADAVGADLERDLYDGAHLEWQEDPNHKGEYKLGAKYPEEKAAATYLRPWFDETNVNWTKDPAISYLFLKGVQTHMNNLLQYRGHVFLNDVYDALGIPRCREGQQAGWLLDGVGDNYIDFGFMVSNDPNTVAFRNGFENVVRLNFNIDGVIWDKI